MPTEPAQCLISRISAQNFAAAAFAATSGATTARPGARLISRITAHTIEVSCEVAHAVRCRDILHRMDDAPNRNSSRRRQSVSRGEPAASRIRRFARMLMHRGENATKEGDFTEAAVQFERAAWAHEYLNDPLAAAEATLELGRSLLYLNHGELLPALAGRIENL
ncbi:MAG: hypothetical protein ABJC13_25955, partial [Acidobacteriota bacterium]